MSWLQVIVIVGPIFGILFFMHRTNIALWNASAKRLQEYQDKQQDLDRRHIEYLEKKLKERLHD